MPQIKRFALAPSFTGLLFLLVFTGCTNARQKSPFFMRIYGGEPYIGAVQVDIIRPDGSYAKTDYGKGSAYFTDSGGNGKIKMIVFGAIKNKDGDAGFSLEGHAREKSWKSKSDSFELEINEKGTISGSANNYPQHLQFSGKIQDTRLELLTELRFLRPPAGGLPAGTKYVFRYTLRRDVNGTTGVRKDCKIVWRPRYVANFDGTGSMIRVPVCE